MIKINLIKHEKVPIKKVYYQLGGIILVLLIALAGVLYYNNYLNTEIFSKNEEISRKRQRLQELREIITLVDKYKQQKLILEKKLKVIEDLRNNQRAPVTLMSKLSEWLPEHVWLTSMQSSGFNVKIKGFALSLAAIGDFISNVNSSKVFKEPKIVHSRLRYIEGHAVYDFEIYFQIIPEMIPAG